MIKGYIPFLLPGVFLFWMLPEIFLNQLSAESTPSQIIIEHHFLSIPTTRSVYIRNQVQAIGVRYHKTYFDFKMRGIYRIGIILSDGEFIVLKQLSTTLQNELSLAYAPDLQIKHNQALATARKIAKQLNLPIKDKAEDVKGYLSSLN